VTFQNRQHRELLNLVFVSLFTEVLFETKFIKIRGSFILRRIGKGPVGKR
jgi:hypothetical protein